MTVPETFRAETRAWLETHCPPSMRTPMPEEERVWGGRNPTFRHPDSQRWLEVMVERGWTVPTWPREYGGGGLDREEAQILKEEMQALGCRTPLFGFGISRRSRAAQSAGARAIANPARARTSLASRPGQKTRVITGW